MTRSVPPIPAADLDALVPTQDRSWARDYRHHESLAFRILLWGTWPLIVVMFALLAVAK